MKEFDYSLVKNPEYFKDGRMDAHSDHISYANPEEDFSGGDFFRHSLNGIWKFHYARNYESTVKGFERKSIPAGTGMISAYLHISDGRLRRSPVCQRAVPMGRP